MLECFDTVDHWRPGMCSGPSSFAADFVEYLLSIVTVTLQVIDMRFQCLKVLAETPPQGRQMASKSLVRCDKIEIRRGGDIGIEPLIRGT